MPRYLVDAGRDPTKILAAARARLDRSLRARPEQMMAWFLRAVAARQEARHRAKNGGDVSASVAAGRAAVEHAVRLSPGSSDAWVESAQLDLVDAAAHGGDHALLHKARGEAEKAVTLDGQYAEAQLVAAQVCLQLATATHAHEPAAKGVAYADAALVLNPRLAEAKKVRAELTKLLP